MKYSKLVTSNPRITRLQSEYEKPYHILHFIISVLFWPYVVLWITFAIMAWVVNKGVDWQIEQELERAWEDGRNDE